MDVLINECHPHEQLGLLPPNCLYFFGVYPLVSRVPFSFWTSLFVTELFWSESDVQFNLVHTFFQFMHPQVGRSLALKLISVIAVQPPCALTIVTHSYMPKPHFSHHLWNDCVNYGYVYESFFIFKVDIIICSLSLSCLLSNDDGQWRVLQFLPSCIFECWTFCP